MLSKSIHDAIMTILMSITEDKNISKKHEKYIIASLAVLHHTLANVNGMITSDMNNCRRIAKKEFNLYLFDMTYEHNYKHCENCTCDICVNMTPDTVHDHTTCKAEFCINMSEADKQKLKYKEWYQKNKKTVQTKRLETKINKVKRPIGRPKKVVYEIVIADD